MIRSNRLFRTSDYSAEPRVMLASGLPDSILSQQDFDAAKANLTRLTGNLSNDSFSNAGDEWKYFLVDNNVGNTNNEYQIGSRTIVEVAEGAKLEGRFISEFGSQGIVFRGGGEIYDSSSPDSNSVAQTIYLQNSKDIAIVGESENSRLKVTGFNQFAATTGERTFVSDVDFVGSGANGDGIGLHGDNSTLQRSSVTADDTGVALNANDLTVSDVEIFQGENGTPLALSGFLKDDGKISNIEIRDVTVTGTGEDIRFPSFDAQYGSNEGILGIETPGTFAFRGDGNAGNIGTTVSDLTVEGLEVKNTNRPLVQFMNGRPEGNDSRQTSEHSFRQSNGAPVKLENVDISYERDERAPAVASIIQGQSSNLNEVQINGEKASELGIGTQSSVNPDNQVGGKFQ